MERYWRLWSQLTGFRKASVGFSGSKPGSSTASTKRMYVHIYITTFIKMFSGTETAHQSTAKPFGASLPCGTSHPPKESIINYCTAQIIVHQ